MISRFFINRPVFACVLSILIVLVGLVALKELPIEQYPDMTPPQILVTASFPGASAETVANTVAAPLEDQINGVENMIYMYSQSSSTGNLSLSIFFKIGTDIDTALNNVQDRVNLANPQLPAEVQSMGVTVKKQTPSILLLVAVQSTDERYDEVMVSNYATIHLADEILRLDGVSNANLINARDYSMRIWLRPDQMAQLGISTSDVVDSIKTQSNDYPIGLLGYPPTIKPVNMTLPMTSLGRLNEPREFDNIVVRANEEGASVLIKDVGRAELGAQDYSVNGAVNGKSAALIAVYQMYGANALDVATEVKSTLERLSKRFPPGMTYSIPYDTTTYIKVSIKEVEKTLYEAAILVAIVVFIFLQSLRATIIPVIAMVVSIVGTFAGMHIMGFSLNTLTLFGLVLAIGIVVDDAIVVVENVERNMRQKGLAPREAALIAMQEVSGPIIAIVFVLCAVFLPVAFLGGIAGQLYRQFAITIAISVIFSGIVALTLSPVLSAYLFKKHAKPGRIAQGFNNFLDRCINVYSKGAAWVLDSTLFAVIGFIVILGCVFFFFKIIPTSLVPEEDQGYLFVFANLPDGASLNRTQAVTDMVGPIIEKNSAVVSFVSMTGFSLLENLNRTTVGTYFVILKDWKYRTSAAMKSDGVLKYLYEKLYPIPEAMILPFNPPAIQGMGTVGGFEFWIVNSGEGNLETLEDVTDQFIKKVKENPAVGMMSSSVQANCMQFFADVDRTIAKAYNVPVGDVYQTLQSLLGSVYVNNFNKYGKVFRVMLQAEPRYRTTLEELGNIYVRSTQGDMVPLKSMVSFRNSKGPNLVSRFNGRPAAKITGGPAPGYSSGQVIKAMEDTANEILPIDMTYSWSGAVYEQLTTGGSSVFAMVGALILVFLILAALYERWVLPISILLIVPFGVLGALISIWLRGINDDVYFQIGLVTLIALAAKNAILIVEFASQRHKEGLTVREAALEAGRLRFRAIIMTSLTFILGVLPLVISTGAGAASRHSVGTGVMGGMIFATFLGIFFIPFFYKVFERKDSTTPSPEEKL